MWPHMCISYNWKQMRFCINKQDLISIIATSLQAKAPSCFPSHDIPAVRPQCFCALGPMICSNHMHPPKADMEPENEPVKKVWFPLLNWESSFLQVSSVWSYVSFGEGVTLWAFSFFLKVVRTSLDWVTEAAFGYSLTTALKSSRIPHEYIYDHLRSKLNFSSYVRECLRLDWNIWNINPKKTTQHNPAMKLILLPASLSPDHLRGRTGTRPFHLAKGAQYPCTKGLHIFSWDANIAISSEKHWRNRTMKEPPPPATATLSTETTTKGNTTM